MRHCSILFLAALINLKEYQGKKVTKKRKFFYFSYVKYSEAFYNEVEETFELPCKVRIKNSAGPFAKEYVCTMEKIFHSRHRSLDDNGFAFEWDGEYQSDPNQRPAKEMLHKYLESMRVNRN